MKYQLLLLTALMAVPAVADVRVRVRVGAGHPIARPHRNVIVRPVRGPVVVRTPVYAAPVIWTRTVVTLPSRDRLVWQDSETIRKREDWVDTTLNVNNRGNALFLNIDGRARIDFAEIHFQNGGVQVVDFKDSQVESGTFRLLDFTDGRHVDAVRLIVKSETRESKVTAYLAK